MVDTLMSKSKGRSVPVPVAVEPPALPDPLPTIERKVSTWKCFDDTTGKKLRLIQAHMGRMNQEEVLELFDEMFENYLLMLEAADRPTRRKS